MSTTPGIYGLYMDCLKEDRTNLQRNANVNGRKLRRLKPLSHAQPLTQGREQLTNSLGKGWRSYSRPTKHCPRSEILPNSGPRSQIQEFRAVAVRLSKAKPDRSSYSNLESRWGKSGNGFDNIRQEIIFQYISTGAPSSWAFSKNWRNLSWKRVSCLLPPPQPHHHKWWEKKIWSQ